MTKMTVQEFVDKYNETPERQRESFLKSIVVTDYVPFELKVALTQDIVQRAFMFNGELFVRTPVCESLFMIMLIEQYTNIEFNKEDKMHDFNLLNKQYLFDLILSTDIVPETEISEFKTIFEMLKNDFMTNNFSLYAIVHHEVSRIIDVVKMVAEPIVGQIDNIDDSDVSKIINAGIESIMSQTLGKK